MNKNHLFYKKSESFIKYFINILLGFFIIYIIYLNIVTHTIKIIPSIILIALMIFIVIFINTLKDEKKMKRIRILIILLAIPITIFIGINTSVEYRWDYGTVHRTAISLAEYNAMDNLDYYIMYENNYFIMDCLAVVYKILYLISGHHNEIFYQNISIAINSIIICFSALLYSILAKKMLGEKSALLMTLLFFMCLPIINYSAILYTDTCGLFLPPLILLLYNNYDKTNKKIYLFLIGVFSGICFLLKPTLSFTLIALILINIFSKSFKKTIIFSFITLMCLFLTYNSVIFVNEKLLNVTPEVKDRYKFPHTHHIMMMLNTTGGFNHNDVNYTYSFNTYKEKKEANIATIKKRLDKRGIKGTIYHLFYTKMIRTWTNVNFASSDYLNRYPHKTGKLYSFISQDGNNNKYYQIYCYSYWMFILIGLITYVIFCFNKKEQTNITILKTCILGLIIFLIIWECNSRYVIQFLPMFILISSIGWVNIINKSKNKI